MPPRRDYSSGLDFSDGDLSRNLEYHPDLAFNATTTGAQPSHLERNKSERRRLQGLQRSDTTATAHQAPQEPLTFGQKFAVWRINEGGRQFFFATWILLHLLVLGFGFINYELWDDYTGARKTFGVTFGMSSLSILSVSQR